MSARTIFMGGLHGTVGGLTTCTTNPPAEPVTGCASAPDSRGQRTASNPVHNSKSIVQLGREEEAGDVGEAAVFVVAGGADAGRRSLVLPAELGPAGEGTVVVLQHFVDAEPVAGEGLSEASHVSSEFGQAADLGPGVAVGDPSTATAPRAPSRSAGSADQQAA